MGIMFAYFAPGAARQVRLRVWRARGDDVPTTVTEFTVATSVTIWTSCDGPELVHRAGPLPPVDVDPQYGEPSMQLFDVPPGTVQEAQPCTFEIGYTELKHGDDAQDAPDPPPKKRERPKLEVDFTWTADGVVERLRSSVTIQRYDEGGQRLLFSGGELAGQLVVMALKGRPATCELELQLGGRTIVDAQRTLSMLGALTRTPGVNVSGAGGLGWDFVMPVNEAIDLPAAQEEISMLRRIAEEFGVDIVVPQDDDVDSWTTAAAVDSAMKTGRVHTRGPFSLFVAEADADSIESKLVGSQQFTIAGGIERWWIGERELDVGPARLVIPRPLIAQRSLIDREGQRSVKFTLSNDSYFYELERWHKHDASPSPADAT